METAPVSREAALSHLEQILRSGAFRGAGRASRLLRFLVERAVDGRADGLKEYTVGVEALGKPQGFDPRTDPIVRAEASRLRSRLARYYAAEGAGSDLMITLPKGSYVPTFLSRNGAGPDVPATSADAVGGVVYAPPGNRATDRLAKRTDRERLPFRGARSHWLRSGGACSNARGHLGQSRPTRGVSHRAR